MKDAYYFSHDSNARNDQKIMSLRSVKGMKGYGIYFGIIEIMREANAYRIPLNVQSIAYDLRESQEDVEDVILNYDLFIVTDNGKFFHSESLLRRMQHLDITRVARSKAGKKGGQASAVAKAQAKLKQKSTSKVKESKVNTTTSHSSVVGTPSLKECQEYFILKGSSEEEGARFFYFYDSKQWLVGKSKMKNWKSAISGWILRNNKQDLKNPLNLNKKQMQNMEALNDFAKRHGSEQ